MTNYPTTYANRFLYFIRRLKRLPVRVLIPMAKHVPKKLTRSTLTVNVRRSPPTISRDALLPYFIRGSNRPLRQAFLTQLANNGGHRLFNARKRPNSLHHLLTRRGHHIIHFRGDVVRTMNTNVIYHDLLRVTRRNTKLSRPTGVTIYIRRNYVVNVLVRAFPFRGEALSIVTSRYREL